MYLGVFNDSGKAGDKNGPKRHQMCHLGPFSVVASYMYYKILVSVLKYMRERKKKTHLELKRCHMHRLSLFWLLPPSIAPLFVYILELIYAIKFLLVAKNMKKKNILTKCPNNASRIIWACFGCCHPLSLSLSHIL